MWTLGTIRRWMIRRVHRWCWRVGERWRQRWVGDTTGTLGSQAVDPAAVNLIIQVMKNCWWILFLYMLTLSTFAPTARKMVVATVVSGNVKKGTSWKVMYWKIGSLNKMSKQSKLLPIKANKKLPAERSWGQSHLGSWWPNCGNPPQHIQAWITVL